MNDFQRFSALVERALVSGWRTAIKEENPDGILVGYEDAGSVWEFTFSVRVDRKWHPAKRSCSPIDMSAPAWEASEEEAPQHKALSMALEMFDDIKKGMGHA